MRPRPGPASSTTRVNRSKSSIPVCRVLVIPVSGAQHASVHEMLQAAVHSIYIRLGSVATSSERCGAGSPLSGSLSGQSPQNFEPAAFKSDRSVEIVVSFQISEMLATRASPSTRCPYGSAHPHTMRPSHNMTSVLHGHVHVNRVAR